MLSLVLIFPLLGFCQTDEDILNSINLVDTMYGKYINDTLDVAKVEKFYCEEMLGIDTLKIKSKIVINYYDNLLMAENPNSFKAEFFFLKFKYELFSDDELVRVYDIKDSDSEFYIFYKVTNNKKHICKIYRIDNLGDNENGELYKNTIYVE
jgi:hypothetical protein